MGSGKEVLLVPEMVQWKEVVSGSQLVQCLEGELGNLKVSKWERVWELQTAKLLTGMVLGFGSELRMEMEWDQQLVQSRDATNSSVKKKVRTTGLQ
jgi:hypothetical protein